VTFEFLADEDFDADITRGVLRRDPRLSITRVAEAGLLGSNDADLLEMAAQNGYVVLTHDAKTMPSHAYARLEAGLPLPGVVVVPQLLPIAVAIEEIIFLARAGTRDDVEGKVLYLPLTAGPRSLR
jgi:hypothetical protein